MAWNIRFFIKQDVHVKHRCLLEEAKSYKGKNLQALYLDPAPYQEHKMSLNM